MTQAELEVLSFLCEARSAAEIAKRLGITAGTVKAHLNKIYEKLDVGNNLEAVLIGLRLNEVVQLQIDRAKAPATVRDWLVGHMTHETRHKGDVLFSKGEQGQKLYFIQKGLVALLEIGEQMSDGDLFGEISLFVPDHARSCTARCETDTQLFSLTAEQATRLFFENAQFGFRILTLIASRMHADILRLRSQMGRTDSQSH